MYNHYNVNISLINKFIQLYLKGLSVLEKFIKSIKMQNFCRYKKLNINFNQNLNIIIGDNESGKSTLLLAIDIVLSGSRSKVETLGLDKLFNAEVINEFLKSDRLYSKLPILYIEIFLNDFNEKKIEGKSHPSETLDTGLYLICEPKDELSEEIEEILNKNEKNFPFEYYSITFKTFADQSYTGYKRFVKHLLIDNSKINNEYATKSYINTVYKAFSDGIERNKNLNKYRKYKDDFTKNELTIINEKIENYSFAIKSDSKNNIETDLTIIEDGIDIENKGMGKKCFIRTEFALQKTNNNLDIILLEEPENHLSHINMHKLIQRIKSSYSRQIFITTHNNLISSRLDLRKSILLNSNTFQSLQLNEIEEETAKFFMKSPNNNLLEYIMSKKVILVEGDAEYILMKQFYFNLYQNKIENSNIHIISVGGTSFKRYLQIAKILEIKTAVIRDNDGNYNNNILESYKDYKSEKIQIFSDMDNNIYTFEIATYITNKEICEQLFSQGRRSLSVQEYMLSNKTECAFEMLEKKGNNLTTPNYIKRAIKWIKE